MPHLALCIPTSTLHLCARLATPENMRTMKCTTWNIDQPHCVTLGRLHTIARSPRRHAAAAAAAAAAALHRDGQRVNAAASSTNLHRAAVWSRRISSTVTRHAVPRNGPTEKPASVLVLGGGVVGLTTAVRLLQALPDLDVTLVADRFGGDTTSNGAAGVWQPYKLSNTPPDLVHRWGEVTFRHLMSLVHSADAVDAGVFLCYGSSLFTEPEPDPVWRDITPGFSRMKADELQLYNDAASAARHDPNSDRINSSTAASTSGAGSSPGPAPLSFVDGYSYNTVVCEGRLYMRWLLQRLRQLGGRVQQRRVQSVEELAGQGWAVVVDCCGLEAPKLFPDEHTYPIRGQVIRVRAPWIKQCVFGHVEDPYFNYYIIPNMDTVVLGGTGQYHDWNREVSLADAERIFARCCCLMPSLKHAEIIEHWTGLRPGRTAVRLEAETMRLSSSTESSGGTSPNGGSGGARELHVVHNYGHGGSGLTLAWGCAGDAVELVQQALGRQP